MKNCIIPPETPNEPSLWTETKEVRVQHLIGTTMSTVTGEAGLSRQHHAQRAKALPARSRACVAGSGTTL
jgi:hypothetical protein